MKILFLADVFGPPGRRAVEERLPGLKEELEVDFCVVNGENAADGAGLTPKLADRILAAGADVVTLGNHVWRRMEIAPYLAQSERVIRPANLSRQAPGTGMAVQPAVDGTPVAVLNLLGWLFLAPAESPFEIVDELVEEARSRAQIVLLDFHAEATSEKVAMARWLDGRVTAVVGTHTHVQTNDARVQPGGTAAITDAGMTGPHDSVIGVDADPAIQRMRTGMAVRFRPAEGDVRIEGVLVQCDGDGRATSCVARAGERLMLAEHVERFNEAVRSGDYGPMLAAFAPDAEMRFEGVAVGPSPGGKRSPPRTRRQPPGDEVMLLTEPRVERRHGGVRLRLEVRGDARRTDDPHRARRQDRAPRRHFRVARVRATLNRPGHASTPSSATRTRSRTSTVHDATSSKWSAKTQYRYGNHVCVSRQAAAKSPEAHNPRRPHTSGTSGMSQIMYCGESTFPRAM